MNHKNHNPEWCSQKQKKNNQCDCIVEVDDVDMTPAGIMTKYVIRYCPIHEQAAALQAENAELRKALEEIEQNDCTCEENPDPKGRDLHHEFCSIGIARQALTRPQEVK